MDCWPSSRWQARGSISSARTMRTGGSRGYGIRRAIGWSCGSRCRALLLRLLRVLDAVGAGQRGLGGLLRFFGRLVHVGALGVDAELDHKIEHDRDRLAVLLCGVEFGLENGVDGALVEAEADGPGDRDLDRLAVGSDDGVIESHAGYAV